MKFDPKRMITRAVAMSALFCMTTQTTFAALLNLAPEPLAVVQVPPKIMLAISKDQQLYKKAYNDYTDLDGDGTIETNYKHTIEYYGYFDPFKCYAYANDRFEPAAKTADKLCGGSHWSGNFLNWVAMARIDAVRKLLYGGLRETDGAFTAAIPNPVTVLERSYLPTDAHSWAKHYNPDPTAVGYKAAETPDIGKLTPFGSDTTTTPKATDETIKFAVPVGIKPGDVDLTFSRAIPDVALGDQLVLDSKIPGLPSSIKAVVLTISGATYNVRLASGLMLPPGNWKVTNLSTAGISFCNTTVGSTDTTSANHRSSTNTNPPLIRVAKGNFALWNANEVWQCQWSRERINTQGTSLGRVRSNGNQAAFSEINASAENPSQTVHAIGTGTGAGKGEFNARVVVCDPKFYDPLTNKENCKKYPNGNLKPIGLLQEYGDTGRFEFGLMTGSYAKNISGGVLRKNPASLKDEVNVDSDGTFREAHSDGVIRMPYRPRGGKRDAKATPSPAGIINTLNYMRIYGYQHATGKYDGSAGDGCPVQLTSLTENSCTSWGNPMSEIFFESVRYFAGKPANYAYAAGNSKDNELGLPLATHDDSLKTKETYCANLNVLMFNAAVADNDDDLRTVSAADINAGSKTIADLTDLVGSKSNEDINGKSFFVGKTLPENKTQQGFELCTAKQIDKLSNASGICPEGPTTGGSYLMAGIAYHAKTTRIRPDIALNFPPATDTKSFKVSTFAVQLASNTPQLEITSADGSQRVVIQPIYRLVHPTRGVGGGGLVDMRYVKIETTKTNSTGKVYVNWEDSEQGGDYDQDMWGTIEWNLDSAKGEITITTNAISASTSNPQGFGYSISGTIYDGPHFHSGILGFNYDDPFSGVDPKVIGCRNCQIKGAGGAGAQSGPQSVTYKLGAAAVNKLQDPMWYAAKYGGFKDNDGDGTPNSRTRGTEEWDSENNATGKPKPDGTPDNYFLVTNPLQLVVALRTALAKLGGDSSGTAVLANSTSLSTTTFLYQARYQPLDWSGQLLAKKVDGKTGIVDTKATWDAGLKLNDLAKKDGRVILTFDDAATHDGVAFTYDTLTPALKTALNTSPVTRLTDNLGAERLAWLRGNASLELQNNKGGFRDRTRSVLGDIANSDPNYVGIPNAPRREASYGDFRRTNYDRTPMLYVGANDGMLHGFDAVTGDERIAYIPSKAHPHLAKLTAPSYEHRFFVDGPTEAADAIVNGKWRTVLVGGLGGGGQGVYALDVTDPSAFSQSTASTHVMWEFNDTHDPDLGYVYGKPVVREMANGKWAAIVSGGYNNSEADANPSDNGRAYLFILYLSGPTGANGVWRKGIDYIKIDTGAGSMTTPNGLAPPFAADVDGDGKTDFAYAGDLQGNLWKFDLRLPKIKAGDAQPDAGKIWTDAKNKTLLFIATEGDAPGSPTQPITGQAEGTPHPTRQGYVIIVGTGQYLEVEDPGPRRPGKTFQPQNLYGIWDKNVAPPISDQATVKRDTLFDQKVSDATTVGGRQVRVFPLASPDWSKHFGWKIDFPNSDKTGERSVFRLMIMGKRLLFTTLIPLAEPCAGGGNSYFFIIDPATGSRVDGPVFDLNGDGLLNTKDQITPGVYASAVKTDVGITPPPVVVRGGPGGAAGDNASNIYGGPAGLAGGPGSVLAFTFFGGALPDTPGMWIGLGAEAGRVSWREILTN